MNLVTINLSSIRKNKHYGRNIQYVEGKKWCEVVSSKPLPEIIQNDFLLTDFNEHAGTYRYVNYGSVDRTMIKLIQGDGAMLTMRHEPREIHFNQAEYFYDYNNPLCECLDCGRMVEHDLIEKELDDEGNTIYTCPFCLKGDFDIQYERIEQALKRLPEGYKIEESD